MHEVSTMRVSRWFVREGTLQGRLETVRVFDKTVETIQTEFLNHNVHMHIKRFTGETMAKTKSGTMRGDRFYLEGLGTESYYEGEKAKYETALNIVKERGITPIITYLPDGSVAIQINEEDIEKLPTFYLEGQGNYPTLRVGGYRYLEDLNITGIKREISNRAKREQRYEEKKKKEKEDPKYRSIFNERMTSKTQISGEVMLDADENYRRVPVSLSVDEYIKIHFPQTKEYTVSETDSFIIMTMVEKGNLVYTRLFGKFNEGRSAGRVQGRCDHLFDISEMIQEKERKKKETESPIYVTRGDGSVTTLERALNNEPDLAPPDTVPRLNI